MTDAPRYFHTTDAADAIIGRAWMKGRPRTGGELTDFRQADLVLHASMKGHPRTDGEGTLRDVVRHALGEPR